MTRNLIAVLINESEILRGDVVPAPLLLGEGEYKYAVNYWAEKNQVCIITRDELIEVLEAKRCEMEAEHQAHEIYTYKIKRIGELIELLKGM